MRYTHIPTGLSGESRSQRSQHKNDEAALKILKARLYRRESQNRRPELQPRHDERGDVLWAAIVRSYVLHRFSLTRDLQTGLEVKEVQQVLDGRLDEFLLARIDRLPGA